MLSSTYAVVARLASWLRFHGMEEVEVLEPVESLIFRIIVQMIGRAGW